MEQRSAPARPFWDRIQVELGIRGWNTSRLERETGVSRQTIAKWKTARRAPQTPTVQNVATTLGINLEEALRLAGVIPADQAEADEDRDAVVARLAAQVAEIQRRLDELTRGGDDTQRKTG